MFNIITIVLICLAIAAVAVAITLGMFIKIFDSKLEPIRKEIKECEELAEQSKTFEVALGCPIEGCKGAVWLESKRFDSIEDFGEWIIEQNTNDNAILAQDDLVKLDDNKLYVLVDCEAEPVISIKDHRGFLYSDGYETSGIKHRSKEIESWVESFNRHCEDLKAANFACNFVE